MCRKGTIIFSHKQIKFKIMTPIHGNSKANRTRYVFQLMKDFKYICISHTDVEFHSLSEFLWKHSLLIDDSCSFARFEKPYATYEYHAYGAQIVIDVIDK